MTDMMPATRKDLMRRLRRPLVRFLFVGFLVAALAYGFNRVSPVVRTCQAQGQVADTGYSPGVSEVSCASSSEDSDGDGEADECSGDVTCEAPGVGNTVASALTASWQSYMYAAATGLENFLWDRVTEFLKSEFLQVQWIEFQMIEWWRAMWSYNLLPGLQAMTRHLNIDLVLQSLNLHNQADATALQDVDLLLRHHAIEDHGIRPGEQVCVAGTLSGGYTRATTFSRAMRMAWETESLATGLNTKDTQGDGSGVSGRGRRYKQFLENFCDPRANSGKNDCAPTTDPELYNADVEVSRRLYNTLTIDVDDDPRLNDMIGSLIDNMVGVPEADPILKGSLDSPHGRAVFLARRSYLARHEAIRSIPHMIASWRMPGSQMGTFVKDLRRNAGIPLSEISDNPSYKEIMHALSVDRFNTGTYAANMMTSPPKLEMEKLNLSVFYLMQLRDYYELLERTALTLAVQVSVMAGQTSKSVGTVPTIPLTNRP